MTHEVFTKDSADTGAPPAPDRKDVASILAPPPVLFFACLLAGYLVDRLVPVRLFPAFPSYRVAAFGCFFLAGLGIGGWGAWVLCRHGTPVDPRKPTLCVVSRGPYRFGRNPLYVALMLVFCAFAALMDSAWMAALAPVLFALLHFGVVLREERYLAERFGEEYRDYARRVRRWI